MRKIFVVILALLVLTGSAFAANNTQESDVIERTFEDGLHVEFIGAYVYSDNGNIHVLFRVTSDIAASINASAGMLFDDRGGRFYLNNIRIAGYNLSKLDVAANVPVIVIFEYPSVYERKLRVKNLRRISSAKFLFNDNELELEGIQLETWRKCLAKMKPLGLSKREWFER